MARYGRSGATEAERPRVAEAALDRCAVHPNGRVLAGDGVSEGLDRRTARMFRGVLRRAPRVKQRRLQLQRMWDFESRGFSNAADGPFRRNLVIAGPSGEGHFTIRLRTSIRIGFGRGQLHRTAASNLHVA